MANIKYIFGSSKIGNNSDMVCYKQTNDIYIRIENVDGSFNYITLDKQTAIKFSKVLRTEISKIED